MHELLWSDEFMSWALGISVWLMFVAVGWKSTARNGARPRGPGIWGWLMLRQRSGLELLNPLFWLLLAMAIPAMLPVLLIRAAREEYRRRKWAAAARRSGWSVR